MINYNRTAASEGVDVNNQINHKGAIFVTIAIFR